MNFSSAVSASFVNVPAANFETVGHLLGNVPCEVPRLGEDVANPDFFGGFPQPEPCPSTCTQGRVGELCFEDSECDSAEGAGDGMCLN